MKFNEGQYTLIYPGLMFQYQNWAPKGIKKYQFKQKLYQLVKKAAKRPVKAMSKSITIDYR